MSNVIKVRDKEGRVLYASREAPFVRKGLADGSLVDVEVADASLADDSTSDDQHSDGPDNGSVVGERETRDPSDDPGSGVPGAASTRRARLSSRPAGRAVHGSESVDDAGSYGDSADS